MFISFPQKGVVPKRRSVGSATAGWRPLFNFEHLHRIGGHAHYASGNPHILRIACESHAPRPSSLSGFGFGRRS